MSGNSWVTLATNDSYSLGALVLGCSLKRTGTVHSLTVLVTPGVSSSMRNQLAAVFNVVQEVNILDSKDEKNLALLSRPELGITFTKIHCWRLTQFSKCVFLDADVLVLRNCDELFEREELSAAPDVGWPDCFNSGVFVYRPSIETYNAIINLALSQGSFDGGDQGLLNQYFSDWATKDISRHLPFIYNMCSSATYSYLPAFKQFGQDVKIVHFIGSSKPWLQYLDSETRQVRPTLGSEHLQGLLQLWWDIFCNDIHSKLSPDMVDSRSQASQLENSTTSHIIKEILLNLPPQQSLKISVPSSSEYTQDPSYGYWDPWELYQDISTQSDNTYGGNSYGSQNISSTSSQNYVIDSVDNRGLSSDFTNNNKNCECLNIENVVEHPPPTPSTAVGNTSSSQYQSIHTVSNYDDNSSCPVVESSESRESVASRNHNMNCGLEFCVTRVEHEHTAEQNIHLNELYSDNTHCDTLHVASKLEVTSEHGIHINCDNNDPANFNDNNLLVPSDNHVYISHDTECLTPPATTELTEPDAGLAGALSQLTLGIARSPEQIALEEHLRKQAWEHGNVDYMGRDSFDNIWQKICQTLAEPLPDTFPEICALPSQVSSVAIDTFPQEVTSSEGVSLSPSQPAESVASENKVVSNISLPCNPSSPDVKLGIASDTALGDVCSFELKDVPVKSEEVPNVVNTVSKISEKLKSSDVSVLGTVSLPDNESDNVISNDSVPTVVNNPSNTNKVSDIVVPDIDETESREIGIPAPSPPISQINIVSEPLICNVGDIREGEIHSVVHSEVPIALPASKMSECEERTNFPSQNIDSLSSKSGTEIVDEDRGSAPQLDGPPVSKDDATKSASPTSVPVDTNASESVSSLDSHVISGLHSSSDTTNQTKTSPFVSRTDEPSSPVIVDKSSKISDPLTVTESSDIQQKVNVPDVPNFPLTSEVIDNTLTTSDFRTELVTPSSQVDSLANIPESSDQNCSPKIVDKIPIASGTLLEPETHISTSSDLPSSLEMKDKSPVTSDSSHKDKTIRTQQEVVSNVSELTSTTTKLPLDPKDASEKLTLGKVPSGLEVCEGENKNRSVETVETLQSVNVIEPTPPTSPLDSVLQTAVSGGSNILSIDSSIPDTPPVGSKSAPIPQGQSNVTSPSNTTSTSSTSPSISTSTTSSIPTTTSPCSPTSTCPPVLTSTTPSTPTTTSPCSATSTSPPVLTSTTPPTPTTTSSSSPTSTSPPVLTSTSPSIPTSPVPESSVSSESSQAVEPQAPVPPKRRHRPSQKTQKGKK